MPVNKLLLQNEKDMRRRLVLGSVLGVAGAADSLLGGLF